VVKQSLKQACTEAGILRDGPQVVNRRYVRLRDDEEVGAGRRPVIPESHQAQGCILAAHAQRCRPQCACFTLTAVKRAAVDATARRASYTSLEPPFATMSQNMQLLCKPQFRVSRACGVWGSSVELYRARIARCTILPLVSGLAQARQRTCSS